jgi:glutamate synthase domain-containing protein 1
MQPAVQQNWSLPPRQGLYDPRFEHDACGIGFVAHVEGRRSHRVLEMGLEALRNHAHRGAVADDRKTGDGAGILTQLPHEFFSRELRRMGVEPPAQGDLAVGQIFFNKGNGEDRALARDLIQEILSELKLEVLAFRSVPVIESALGQRALYSRPWLGQVLVRRTDAACGAGDAFERLLYVARKRIINTARARGMCSDFTFPASAAAPSSTRA